MGCDIHSVAQIRKIGHWETIAVEISGDNRNYDTFGMLADVRNGFGFAGCDTGDAYEPIAEPRGLPSEFIVDDDYNHLLDFEFFSEFDEKRSSPFTRIWMGDHSHSWLLLSEMKNYVKKNEHRKRNKRGYVTEATYLAFRDKGFKFVEWSNGVYGDNIISMTSEQYEALDKKFPLRKEIYVQAEWTENYDENKKLVEIIAALESLAQKYSVGTGDIRFVFGFDS